MIKLLCDNIFLSLAKLLNVPATSYPPKKKSNPEKDSLKSNDNPNNSSSIEENKKLHKVIHSKMNDQMLGRKEAAEFLGVKENTLAIWKLTNRQIIPTYKVGKFIKYKASDLQKFIDEKLL